MHLVFIYGPPAAGKYTIARQLSEQLDYPLFHNHLVVDAVASVFPFGSPSFTRLREAFWMDTFAAAIADDLSLIFTFQPEPSVAPDFAGRVADMVRQAGSRIDFVRLTLALEEQEARIDNADRAAFGKLRSPDLLKTLHADFEASEQAMPTPMLTLDTAHNTPEQSTRKIMAALQPL